MVATLRKVGLLVLAGAGLGFAGGLIAGPWWIRLELRLNDSMLPNTCRPAAEHVLDRFVSYVLFGGLAGGLVIPLTTGLVLMWWRRRQAAKQAASAPATPPVAPPAA